MAGCKLTKNLGNKTCGYALAGARAIYLANFYTAVGGTARVPNAIAYEFAPDGTIVGIHLPVGEQFYKITAEQNTPAFNDALLVGGNGGKYRQHTLNATVNQLDVAILNEGDALSLGRFIAVVVDNAGRVVLLGRTSGLTAPAGGFDYNSGAAEADATGWTLVLQGVSTEIVKVLKSESLVSPPPPPNGVILEIFPSFLDVSSTSAGGWVLRSSEALHTGPGTSPIAGAFSFRTPSGAIDTAAHLADFGASVIDNVYVYQGSIDGLGGDSTERGTFTMTITQPISRHVLVVPILDINM